MSDKAEAAPEAADAAKEEEKVKEKAPPKKAKKAEKEKNDVNEENKENKEENKDEGKEGKEEKPKKVSKPIKKTIPTWATLSDDAKAKLAGQTKLKVDSDSKPNIEETIVEAIKEGADSKGVASAAAIRKYIKNKNPTWPKMLLKKGLNRALDKKRIKRIKGKGLSGSFKIDSTYKPSKTVAKKKVSGKKDGPAKPTVPLADIFPIVFTWACNPKEASVGLIRKYLNKHHTDLATDGMQFKKALENGVAKGQLKRLTGTGCSGTFQLVDGADKTGAKYEDAIEDAIIAMNEPKDLSVNGLRNYLGEYHKEYNTDQRPKVLKNALDNSEARGHVQHISGKGFSGTYRLMYPFYPSPFELWGEEAKEKKVKEVKVEKKVAKVEKKVAKKRASRKDDSSDDEEESNKSEPESEDESDGEYIPKATKRGAPKPRKDVVAKKKVKKSAPEKKPKKAAPVKKPVAKKAPAKNKRKGKK